MPNQRTPNLEILELRDDFVKFRLSKTDVSMANALRRVMIAETPTLTIDKVEIEVNSSPLHDAFLAQRLGLVPLVANKSMDQYLERDECLCASGCDKCTVEFTLDKWNNPEDVGRNHSMISNVNNENEEEIGVYSTDLQQEHSFTDFSSNSVGSMVTPAHYSSSDERDNIIRSENGILLCKLGKNQRIKLRCIATKGIGKEHAKFSPVAVATYTYEPLVSINYEKEATLTLEQKTKFVNCCPKKVFKLDKQSNKLMLKSNGKHCIYCNECKYASKDLKLTPDEDPLVEVAPIEDTFIFSVECTGALKADEVVSNALQILLNKVTHIQNQVDQAVSR